eukprot:10367430-Lingulodinium_polyedra.AAC.1
MRLPRSPARHCARPLLAVSSHGTLIGSSSSALRCSSATPAWSAGPSQCVFATSSGSRSWAAWVAPYQPA